MKYIIINTSEVHNTTYGYDTTGLSIEQIVEKENENPYWKISFDGLEELGVHQLVMNNDKTKCILSYSGECPSFLKDKKSYTSEEIEEEKKKSEWN